MFILQILIDVFVFSTVSSGMNSLSTLILEDLIRPIAPPLNENLSFRISQLLGLCPKLNK